MGPSLNHPIESPKVLLGEEGLLMTGHILWVWLASGIKWIIFVAALFIWDDGLISSEMWYLERNLLCLKEQGRGEVGCMLGEGNHLELRGRVRDKYPLGLAPA